MPLVRWSWLKDDKEKSLNLLTTLSEEIMAGKAKDPAKRRDELLKSMGGSKHHEKKTRRGKHKGADKHGQSSGKDEGKPKKDEEPSGPSKKETTNKDGAQKNRGNGKSRWA